MSILILSHQGSRQGTKILSRVLIGRRSMNHLVIDDPAVSRMHAWIDEQKGTWYLTDMRSRTGTLLNGERVSTPRALYHGDVIGIGPATLKFFDDSRIPLDIQPFELPREPLISARDVGIRFDCPHCRAPMWAAPTFAGHSGLCTYCGGEFTIPIATPAQQLTPPVKVDRAKKYAAAVAAFDAGLDSLQAKPSAKPVTKSAEPSAARGGLAGALTDLPDPRIVPASLSPRPAAPAITTPTIVSPAIEAPIIPAPIIQPPAMPASSVPRLAAPPGLRAETSAAAVATAIRRPAQSAVVAQPKKNIAAAPSKAPPQTRCGVCQSPILAGEAQTSCPSCGLAFHQECWQENYGCSAYGCPQVDALKPPEAAEELPVAPDASATEIPTDAPPGTPWEFVLLAASVFAAILSAFSFGGASLLTLGWSLAYWMKSRNNAERKTAAVIAAAGLSFVGAAAGAAVSYYLFVNGRKPNA